MTDTFFIHVGILHQLNPRLQFKNDTFELKHNYECSCPLFNLKRLLRQFFSHSNMVILVKRYLLLYIDAFCMRISCCFKKTLPRITENKFFCFLKIWLSRNQSINASINQWNGLSINQWIDESINQSINSWFFTMSGPVKNYYTYIWNCSG